MKLSAVIFAILTTCSTLLAQERTIVFFEKGALTLDSLQRMTIETSATELKKLLAEDDRKICMDFIARTSQEEFDENRFIGVSRALVVRDYFIECLKQLDYPISLWRFGIIDLGVTEEKYLHGIQLSGTFGGC